MIETLSIVTRSFARIARRSNIELQDFDHMINCVVLLERNQEADRLAFRPRRLRTRRATVDSRPRPPVITLRRHTMSFGE